MMEESERIIGEIKRVIDGYAQAAWYLGIAEFPQMSMTSYDVNESPVLSWHEWKVNSVEVAHEILEAFQMYNEDTDPSKFGRPYSIWVVIRAGDTESVD